MGGTTTTTLTTDTATGTTETSMTATSTTATSNTDTKTSMSETTVSTLSTTTGTSTTTLSSSTATGTLSSTTGTTTTTLTTDTATSTTATSMSATTDTATGPSVPMDGRWHCHDSTNSWSGMGSSGLEDSDQDSWKGLSMSDCMDHCKRDSNDQCGCVVHYRCPSSGCEHGFVDGQCWRRGYCDLSKSKRSDPGFTMCNINLG